MHTKLLSDIEIFPEVVDLIEFYFEEIKGQETGEALVSAILGSGYNSFTYEQRLQFIAKMEELGENMHWIPYRTEAERIARYEQRKRDEQQKNSASRAGFKQCSFVQTPDQLTSGTKKREELIQKDEMMKEKQDQYAKNWEEFQSKLPSASISAQEGASELTKMI
jgi:hypothetical protein